jgi:hypothetical protein
MLGLLLAVSLTACGNDAPTPSKESTMTNPSTVSMEAAIARYEEMRQKMVAALGDELGPRTWQPAPNEDGIIRAGCNDDDEAETVNLRTLTVQGTYPEQDWKRGADLVEQVGRHYGFDTVRVVVDRPGDFSMTGLAEDGASYQFGLAANTILGVRTGCHRWENKPGADG